MQVELAAMEPLARETALETPGFIHQLKWDGVRIFAWRNSHGLQLYTRRGSLRNEQYPEMAALTKLLPPDSVLDGEVVVLLEGKPSFHGVLQRDLVKQAKVIAARERSLPISYALFDLLYWRGEDVRPLPLFERQGMLAGLADKLPPFVHLVENFPSGQQLFAATQTQGLEGIVSKRLSSPYIPGKKHDHWFKVKNFREAFCAIGGYTLKANVPSALLLGLYGEEGLIYVGRAGSGLSQSDWQDLLPFFQAATTDKSPFISSPRSGSERETRWLVPVLGADIKFMEWSVDLKLRAPVVKGFRQASPELCRWEG